MREFKASHIIDAGDDDPIEMMQWKSFLYCHDEWKYNWMPHFSLSKIDGSLLFDGIDAKAFFPKITIERIEK